MFIQTESTPNPLSLKFIPDDHEVAGNKTYEFKNKKQAQGKSILAEKLFEIKAVDSIFFGSNFITINKKEADTWEEIKTEILTTIMDFFLSKKPIVNDVKEESESDGAEDSEIVKQIKELIEMKVRPAVAMDGGDIIPLDTFA